MVGIRAGSSSPIESIPLAHEGWQWVWMATGEAPVSATTVMFFFVFFGKTNLGNGWRTKKS